MYGDGRLRVRVCERVPDGGDCKAEDDHERELDGLGNLGLLRCILRLLDASNDRSLNLGDGDGIGRRGCGRLLRARQSCISRGGFDLVLSSGAHVEGVMRNWRRN